MPIYEYRCELCGHEMEAIQKISDDPLVECPECRKPGLRKLLSASAFRLKGGGWYETDFKKGKQKNLHDAGKAGSAPGVDKPAAGKSDTKPSSSGGSSGSGPG